MKVTKVGRITGAGHLSVHTQLSKERNQTQQRKKQQKKTKNRDKFQMILRDKMGSKASNQASQPEGHIENILEQAKQDEHIEDTEDKKITSVENLKKLVEAQADETKDTSTEEIERLDKVRHAALSKEENSRYFDKYTPDNILKILSNLEENDRVTIKTDSLNPIGISIIRIIDSSPDSLQRIELMRLSIDKINTAYFLGKSNDTVGICTLQLIGRTDRNAGVDLEEFCVKYNVWAQRTKYMSI